MKRACALLLILAVVAAAAYAADPVEGCWISWDEKTGKPTAGWEIFQEGGILYGKILSVADKPQDAIATACKDNYKGFPESGKVSAMNVVGTRWIFGLREDKTGVWSGGHIIDPSDGKMYGCKITFHPQDGKKYKIDTLEMRGTVGPFWRSQFWQRASPEEASALR